MNSYRVDLREFKVGDVVTPAGEYISKLDSERVLVERYLEEKRPESKPRRSDVLFVFESRNAAERLWMKLKGGKLYEVNFQDSALHRGDMNLTELIYQMRADSGKAGVVAENYWAGQEGESSEIELLVQKAVVVRVIFETEVERRQAFGRSMGFSALDGFPAGNLPYGAPPL